MINANTHCEDCGEEKCHGFCPNCEEFELIEWLRFLVNDQDQMH